jgi:hypothetical protein
VHAAFSAIGFAWAIELDAGSLTLIARDREAGNGSLEVESVASKPHFVSFSLSSIWTIDANYSIVHDIVLRFNFKIPSMPRWETPTEGRL